METSGYSGITPDRPSDDRASEESSGSRFGPAPTFDIPPSDGDRSDTDPFDADRFDTDPLGLGTQPDAAGTDEVVDFDEPAAAPAAPAAPAEAAVSLLAPPAETPPTSAGLPMSLAIAAEEAAREDISEEPESRAATFEGLYSPEPEPRPEPEPAPEPVPEPVSEEERLTAPIASSWSTSSLDGPEPGSGATDGTPGSDDDTGGPAVALAESEIDENAYNRLSTEPVLGGEDIVLVDLLLTMLERGASDLHITAGARPAIRVNGELAQMDEFPVLTPPVIQRVMYAAITQRQWEIFEETLELDFAYSVPGRARFRVNMYRQRDAVGAAFRIIPFEIKRLEDLGVPNTVSNFAMLPRGFVLVTGPTGSGKSTTLASLIDLANRQRRDHIMTCEDPIEFLHRHRSCLVNQREVGEDTHSFQNALKHVLRQDPDIILVGEMRDLETISVALTAAETGHLVFATLHTQDAAQTIDRVIDVFPPHQQQQVRAQLATAIQGVVCQTLAKSADGRSRVVACEVMVATPAIRNLIREGKTHQIYSSMQAGSKFGMQTMDQHLADLVNKGRITYETGIEKCHHIEDFNRLTGRG